MSKTIANPADNVCLEVSVGKKEIFSAVGHTAAATGKVRRRKEKEGRHPRFFQATVTSARGREMEPRDKGGGSITLRATPRHARHAMMNWWNATGEDGAAKLAKLSHRLGREAPIHRTRP